MIAAGVRADADIEAVEYTQGGTPISIRTTPSASVVRAIEELRKNGTPLRTALDLGCGKGRNSLYLAEQGLQVTAIDFTPDAIAELQKSAAEHHLTDKIRAIVYDVTEPWPVAEGSMDIIIDAFCFKHITQHTAREGYKTQLLRALRSRGHYLISFVSIGDGYYGHYILKREVIDGAEERLVADPVNGIESVLYTPKRVMQFFAPELIVFKELNTVPPSDMDGEDYEDRPSALLMYRNPHMA